MPLLLRWQVELTSDYLLGQEQITTALHSVDRLDKERKALVNALEDQEGKHPKRRLIYRFRSADILQRANRTGPAQISTIEMHAKNRTRL